MKKKDTKFGADLMAALKEVHMHRRGEIALPTRLVNVISAQRVKAIRTSLAKGPKEFEARLEFPHEQSRGWEQGRKLDVAASILMTVIEKEPEVVAASVERLNALSP